MILEYLSLVVLLVQKLRDWMITKASKGRLAANSVRTIEAIMMCQGPNSKSLKSSIEPMKVLMTMESQVLVT
eukprot:CAMPEP_0204911274 /NCGR_PEP_ID=MMETSP1397-20131031/9654_1 /ASSEMBLY_ACC=CAM_ASM_000891 /TAXON_ID=49980 /ORGANISM="Climacostomum Climacostomum virens, Strain Stock W-24" /LENGTH=71 /DNA_ID=CAMNT_0052081765 /DNA_START=144 /DNA_END=359 /DNA_ORIENTATION=-